ncbi:MAG TPA: sugar ABC transporter substrate-binding protein, partial [Clostridia bacterium]
MKKVLVLLLAFAMLLTAAACGSKTESGNAVPAPSSGSDTSAQTSSDKPADTKPERTKIRVEVFDRGTDGGKTDPTNNYWTDWIKAKVLEDE